MMFETYVPAVVDYNYFEYSNLNNNNAHSKMLGYNRPMFAGANFFEYASFTGNQDLKCRAGGEKPSSPTPSEPATKCKYMTKLNMRRRKTSLGSSVAIHKLRETKWFTQSERNVFSAVTESGFIVERKPIDEKIINKSHSDTTLSSAVSEDSINCAEFLNARIVNETSQKTSHSHGSLAEDKRQSQWGVVLWEPGKEKTKNPEHLTVFTVTLEKANKYKVKEQPIADFWTDDTILRINNVLDREKKPNSEINIRAMLDYAQKNKMKWTDSNHFVRWCRYENIPEPRSKRITDYLKLRQMGLTAASLFSSYNRKASC